MRCGLIGKPLGHSYSKIIHEKLGSSYDLLEVDENEILPLMKSGKYNGFNVTIPYKKTVIDLLDEVDPLALSIGAVNTVKIEDGKRIGYNTDVLGMEYLIGKAEIELKGKTVMILGTGGTSNTARAVCERAGAKNVITVGRSSPVNYQNCYDFSPQIIINATPVGMFPNEDSSPVDLKRFDKLEGVVDVIYNPLNTKLVLDAKELKIKAVGGLDMLVAQAVFAYEIFSGTSVDKTIIDKIMREIRAFSCGIVFIGMPGSGKSTLAKLTAEAFNKEFVDTDKEIEKMTGMTIPEIFSTRGEEYFREVEALAVKSAAEKRNAVIATGGGAVLRAENRHFIKKNSVVIHVKRRLDSLDLSGRPLSVSIEKNAEIERQRMPIYCDLADFSVNNDSDIPSVLQKIKELII